MQVTSSFKEKQQMSDTPQKLIVDVEKGTHTYVDLTAAEIAERDQMAAQAEIDRA